VQTCALPISPRCARSTGPRTCRRPTHTTGCWCWRTPAATPDTAGLRSVGMRRRGIWLAPLLVLGLTSCGEPAATGAPDVGADAYVAAISEFLPPAPVDESEAKPVVFITPVGTEPLSLDDQVA